MDQTRGHTVWSMMTSAPCNTKPLQKNSMLAQYMKKAEHHIFELPQVDSNAKRNKTCHRINTKMDERIEI